MGQLQRIFEEIFQGSIQMVFYFRPGMMNNRAQYRQQPDINNPAFQHGCLI
ncbi:conserved hypothetical protein [Xenorhabdus nematophila F1]|uniref:Uncharacterized protein n=1 Tax=Xenorhabdus nematophila (strain ATCC 19061 / DSM 3370 / CCUG 14189 / LMG 1036 / NCIMB 9965 / AN6) TaxID=406817 RepID=D3VEL2_XENNA|nr:hypothetical protein XNC1_2064 [Xenorhabdus nematophila ATCC 19061]CCW32106.1 conserved hypothetical protein [Xenorhabdus nematophila F1]